VWYVKYKDFGAVEYFTQKEADRDGIAYIHWREATEAGQWVLTDDQYVLKTVGVKYITEVIGNWSRVRRRVMMGLGNAYPHGKMLFEIKNRIKYKCLNDYIPKPWYVRFDRDNPDLKSVLAKMVLMGKLTIRKDPHYFNKYEYAAMIEAADMVLAKNFNWYTVRTFFRNDGARKLIRDEIAKIAKDRGINVDKVFDILGEAEEFGRKKKDPKAMIALAKEYAAIVGMNTKNNGNHELPPHSDEELPGSEFTFDNVISKERIVEQPVGD
jgi:hypothetical protein